MGTFYRWLFTLLGCAALWFTNVVAAEEPTVISGPLRDIGKNATDTSVKLSFKPPTGYVEMLDLALKNNLFKLYQLPNPNGASRSFFTVAFQQKSHSDGLRNLNEFVNTDLYHFRQQFPQAIIGRVNWQGIVAEKFSRLGFPMQTYVFKGNQRPQSVNGDSLTLFFETPAGYWSVAWTVPQPAIQTGLPVFEGFIADMSTEKLPYPLTE